MGVQLLILRKEQAAVTACINQLISFPDYPTSLISGDPFYAMARTKQTARKPTGGKAASHQGCQEECSQHWWRQEAPQIQAWHGCSAGNSTLPEVYRTVDQKASLSKTGA